MFGLFYLFIRGAISFVGKQVEDVQNAENKRTFANSNGYTYTDQRGSTRLISNNHRASYKTADVRFDKWNGVENRDYILIDLDDHCKVVHNFSLGDRLKKNIEIVDKYKDFSTEPYDENYHNSGMDIKNKVIRGKRYYDKKTGEELVIRKWITRECNYYVFVSTQTGFIVRETDHSYKTNGPIYLNGDPNKIVLEARRLDIDKANKQLVTVYGCDTKEKRLEEFRLDPYGYASDAVM